VTAGALPMIGPFEIESGFRPVASGTLNLLISLCQFAFIQDIFALFIEMVAILTGDSLFGMEIVRKDDRGPLFP